MQVSHEELIRLTALAKARGDMDVLEFDGFTFIVKPISESAAKISVGFEKWSKRILSATRLILEKYAAVDLHTSTTEDGIYRLLIKLGFEHCGDSGGAKHLVRRREAL